MAKEVTLPSGAVLKITPAPFAAAKALYNAVLEEVKHVQVTSQQDVMNVLKDILAYGYSSKRIETCLAECLKRCTYDFGSGDLKIDESTFEPVERREDYTQLCFEVAYENIAPFGKGLSVVFKRLALLIPSDPT